MPSKWLSKIIFCCFTFLLMGCTKSKPTFEYMPDMQDSPALKAQKFDKNLPHGRAMRNPVEGTVPRHFQPYPYKGDPEGAAVNLENPLERTEEVLEAGQKIFNIYCAVCHGEKGRGDGSIVPPFPRPPSFHTDKVRGWEDGRIFHVITEGQNIMPSYASQIEPDARWAVIHYLRALQRAENPTPGDIDVYKQYRKERKQ